MMVPLGPVFDPHQEGDSECAIEPSIGLGSVEKAGWAQRSGMEPVARPRLLMFGRVASDEGRLKSPWMLAALAAARMAVPAIQTAAGAPIPAEPAILRRDGLRRNEVDPENRARG